jgi:hypothetical protein
VAEWFARTSESLLERADLLFCEDGTAEKDFSEGVQGSEALEVTPCVSGRVSTEKPTDGVSR